MVKTRIAYKSVLLVVALITFNVLAGIAAFNYYGILRYNAGYKDGSFQVLTLCRSGALHCDFQKNSLKIDHSVLSTQIEELFWETDESLLSQTFIVPMNIQIRSDF